MTLLRGLPKPLWKTLVIFFLWTVCTASSCTSSLRNEQLENVAKDWALVIRASQVIPVYPLTEDLQPGDVLLVSTPINDQVALYKEKGFLPLDQHLIRLYSADFQQFYTTDYKNFYNSRYGINSTIPPADWQIVDSTTGQHHWKIAPRAAFPTYQFSVATGSGLNLAIPIQGIPFALGLMNSGKASGTVTLADAFTYGLDNVRLSNLVQAWANQKRAFLKNYSPRDGNVHFLRVVSRVYVTGQVSVTLNNDEANSSELRGGADRPVELLGITKGAPEQNYSAAIRAINTMADSLPGGKVKVASASSRSVTLSEAFPRPLVIGYVGFDMQILEGGRLGPPISTLAQLTSARVIPAQASENIYRLAALGLMDDALRAQAGPNAEAVRRDLNDLAKKLPERYSFSLYDFSGPGVLRKDSTVVQGTPVNRQSFSDVLEYLGNAQTTITTLNSHIARMPSATQTDRSAIITLERDRQAAHQAYDEVSASLSAAPALMRGIDLFFLQQ
jgi:hypothetical protein